MTQRHTYTHEYIPLLFFFTILAQPSTHSNFFTTSSLPLTSFISLPYYSEIDREDLAVQMRKRIGDYSRVVYLLRNGTGEELYTLVCVCMRVFVCVCVHTHVRMYASVCVRYICMCACVCMYACVCMRVCVCVRKCVCFKYHCTRQAV